MNRRGNNISKHLKDYMVPIIAVFLILLLLISVFSGDNTPTDAEQIKTENQLGLQLGFDSANTEGQIVYLSGNKKDIEMGDTLYKSEKVMVKEGALSLELSGFADIILKKNGELKYEDSGKLTLFSSDLWVNTASQIDIDMRFAQVAVGINSTVSLSQNEVGSTIYLLSGFVEVSNMAGKSTVLTSGQKITIARLDSNKDDIDVALLKKPIDEFFKTSDWFIKNNGSFYLSQSSSTEEEEKTEGSIKKSSTKNFISFNNLEDESQVSDSSITISGKYTDEEITSITLNGAEAALDSEAKTFTFKNISTSDKVNDLIFKVNDDAGDVLEKILYTVYYDTGVSSGSTGGFKVKTYDVDGSLFTFTAPKVGNSYTTYSNAQVTIKGRVSQEGVAKVTVNDYTLKSFNGTTWRYHASPLNNNLKDGTNVYQVNYYDKDGNLMYTNNYTIIKKVLGETTLEEKEEKLISNEA